MAYAVILFSGESRRFKGDELKQFTLVNGIPLFMYSVLEFFKNENIKGIVLVTNEDRVGFVKTLLSDMPKPFIVVRGGETRTESSFNGLLALQMLGVNDNDKVLIHDAARPLVSQKMINDVFEALDHCECCTIASDCTNTLVDLDGRYLDRSSIKVVGTPQGFIYQTIMKAHMENKTSQTDDTTLVKEMGKQVELVINNHINIKVTTKEDIEVVSAMLKGRQ